MTSEKSKPASQTFIEKIHPVGKLVICLSFAVIIYFFVQSKHIDTITRVLLAWEAFSLSLIILDWITFSITKPNQIRQIARIEDSSRTLIFLLILIATLASFLAILLLVVTKEKFKDQQTIHLIIAVTGLIVSWFLIHTIFTLRYAHIYYDDDENNSENHAAGLIFPEDDAPDYMDFAYFSFVLGMTFQVSDVNVSSKRIRRLAMWHGMLSFGYNTIMIALTINMIAGFGT